MGHHKHEESEEKRALAPTRVHWYNL